MQEFFHAGTWWELVTPDLPDLSAVDRASLTSRIPVWRPVPGRFLGPVTLYKTD